MFGSEKFFGAGGGAASFYSQEIGNSLKFEDGDSSYLSRTPSSAGNRKVFTFSCWLKRGNLTDINLLGAGTGSDDRTDIAIADNAIFVQNEVSNDRDMKKTTALLRDPSAWYHIVVALDLTASSNSDKVKIYINGDQQTSFATDNTFANVNTYINGTNSTHYIGRNRAGSNLLDGYLAEVNFIDGLQLTPSSFGETKEGIWIPKDPTGLTYGTNGFRLPFTETTSANGFNTVTYTGTAATQSVEGVGFQPDFVWVKNRSNAYHHGLFDSVRGANKVLKSSATSAEATFTKQLTSFDTDGFSLGDNSDSGNYVNISGHTYVGWCWGGGTNDKTYTVTVVDDSGNKYRFDGHGTSSIALNLTEGATYTFNYPSGHPLRFSTTSDGTHGGGSEYTTGVTYVSSTQVKITVASGAPTLYYYCSLHSGMGGQINTNTTDAPTHAEGTILSRVKPNADYGFSIVSFTGNSGTSETVGHGLGVTPSMIIVKDRDLATTWLVYVEGVTDTVYKYLGLNSTAATTTNASTIWGSALPTSSVFGANFTQFGGGTNDFIAYCFADVTGYQKIGTYSGTGSSGNAITGLGFKPAWLMVKRTDSTGSWQIFDTTRDPSGSMNKYVYANLNNAEASDLDISSDADGFTVNSTNNALNNASGTYIYLAIADTRDALFTSDASGNGNNWTPNDLQHSDVMPDTPTDGFATLNILDERGTVTLQEGNLAATISTNGNVTGTIAPSSGKWYWETYINDSTNPYLGIQKMESAGSSSTGYSQDAVALNNVGDIYYDGSKQTEEGSPSWTNGDIIGCAYDVDNNKIWWSKNGQWYSADASSESAISVATVEAGNNAYDLSSQITNGVVFYGSSSTSGKVTVNFGQDSSFNANKIAQGNADDNGKGDFFYAPPSGYLALCNANLPDPAIDPAAGNAPEDYFNTVFYSGNSGTNAVTGVGFQPDWTWVKSRNTSGEAQKVVDSVRGAGLTVFPSSTSAEIDYSGVGLNSFDTDGFTVSHSAANNQWNVSGRTYVAWNWKAGGTAASNSDGSITSSVSANTDAGFSIVSYTGTGANATVGHGLGSAPKMIIIKNRTAYNWIVGHNSLTSWAYNLQLSSTVAQVSSATTFNSTAPTSSVFSIGTNVGSNDSGDGHIAYCFAEKDGYSKFGSYKGNGSTGGPFVYTGFRPAFVIIKNASATEAWHLIDSERSPHNVANAVLYPNSSAAESNPLTAANTDFLSNGFKIRAAGGNTNDNNLTYIYMAFAEQPFKYSNAR